MPMIKACRVELSPQFGNFIYRDQPVQNAMTIALEWLEATLDGQRFHKNLKVQSCEAPQLEPIGIERIDKMLGKSRNGFVSGNVGSNLQTSMMLPAFNQCEVNGLTVINGKPLMPGDLQAKAFRPFFKSAWNDQFDGSALLGAKEALKAVPPDRGTTLYHIMHTRTKETRYAGPSQVHTHGWLLVDDRDELRYECRIGNSEVGHKLFERAKQVLTNEHTNAQTLLEIKDGRIIFVDRELMTAFHAMGQTTSAEEIAQFLVPLSPWEIEQIRDMGESDTSDTELGGAPAPM